ncbi:MAG: hypothetical protein KC643_33580 [Nitrospira sp.]|nr:hypothetical protein [Nitrospira sp.]
MPMRPQAETPAHLNIRDIPRSTLFRLKMAAAAEQRTVKDLVLELIEGKIQELEKKGYSRRGKIRIKSTQSKESYANNESS